MKADRELVVTIGLDWGTVEELAAFADAVGDFVMESGRLPGLPEGRFKFSCSTALVDAGSD